MNKIFMSVYIAIIGAVLCPSPNVWAQSQIYDVRPQATRITGQALPDTFGGMTHEGAYNFDYLGRPGARFIETHFKDGKLLYVDENFELTGSWAVKDNMVCYEYDSTALTGTCFQIYKLGTCYYFYNQNRIKRIGEEKQIYWTARSVKKGDHTTCEELIM